ncbi:unnamed protein product [Vitrella brassicaformis CCMP3155]|uniref:Ubiquitin-like protease family profile domain-containing protein n=1 Tax=Vitrella brassicaformis (strain CCMP3155) TaxID=1169540 RepID=A0A0G4EBZ0_VITBC|nr:unnamed protein product [Vitrella brassicaformis CCMP3155]|eukprot:CEL92829.1 unnamed protein product [Vitrella brassicaformis CCMP3155]
MPSTFFWPKVVRVMPGGYQYDYSAVRRWSSQANVNVFDLDYLMVPLHDGYLTSAGFAGTHWTLGLMDFRRKRIRVLDSLGGGGTNWSKEINATLCQYIARYLQDEHADNSSVRCRTSHSRARKTRPLKEINCERSGSYAIYATGQRDLDQAVLITRARRLLALSIMRGELPITDRGAEMAAGEFRQRAPLFKRESRELSEALDHARASIIKLEQRQCSEK